MGYLVARETYVMLFLSMHCCKIHTIGLISVCANFEINWYTVMNLENMQNRVLFDVTWHKNGTSYIMETWYFDQEQFETNQKSIRLPVQKLWLKLGVSWFWDIDLDIWPMFYFVSHALGMKYWHLHAKFHKNRSSINGWYALDTHTNTKHTPKVKSIVSQISSGLD